MLNKHCDILLNYSQMYINKEAPDVVRVLNLSGVLPISLVSRSGAHLCVALYPLTLQRYILF